MALVALRKKKVLFAWEFGGHLGHILNMLPLARELASRDFDVAFALKDLSRANIIFEIHPEFQLFQSPDWKILAQDVAGSPQSLAQVLQRHGYKSAAAVEGLARAWLSIYNSISPDLVVYDYSFTAQLAYRDLSATQVTLGSGFFSPSFDQYAPSFWPEQEDSKQLEADEEAVVGIINAVGTKLGKKEVAFLSDLNKVDGNFLSSLPELDHYGERKDFTYIGPLLETNNFQIVKWLSGSGTKKIFGYLKPSDSTEKLLSILADNQHEAHFFMPGLSQNLRKRYESRLLKFSTKPFDMKDAALSADLAICNAGHGTVSSLLLHGCPLLLLPQQAEQYLLSRRTAAMGVSEMIAPDEAVSIMHRKLTRMLEDSSYKTRAAAFAKKYHHLHDARPAKTLADSIVTLMDRGK